MRLVNTIEYKEASDPIVIQKNSTLEEECVSEEGWCPVTSSYPIARVEQAVANCPQVVEAFKAVVTKDLDLLGDNSPSVISSEKDLHRPWSWKEGFEIEKSPDDTNLRCMHTRSGKCALAR